MRALVEGDAALKPQDLARHAFDEAGQSLGRLADELTRDPAASCPAGQFLSTWKYILRKGLLLQSTLTLAWLDRRCLHVAMVGDGGGVWRGYGASPGGQRANDSVLAQCDLDRHQVCALGPAERSLREFDCWRQRELDGPFLLRCTPTASAAAWAATRWRCWTNWKNCNRRTRRTRLAASSTVPWKNARKTSTTT